MMNCEDTVLVQVPVRRFCEKARFVWVYEHNSPLPLPRTFLSLSLCQSILQ